VEAICRAWRTDADAPIFVALIHEIAPRLLEAGGPASWWWSGARSSGPWSPSALGFDAILYARSELEIIREMFAGTSWVERVAELETTWVDDMLRAILVSNERPPEWVPRSHWWWWAFVEEKDGGAPETLATRGNELRGALALGDPTDVVWRIQRLWWSGRDEPAAMVGVLAETAGAVAAPIALWWAKTRARSVGEDDLDHDPFLARTARSYLELARDLYPAAVASLRTDDVDRALREDVSSWTGRSPWWVPTSEYARHWWWGERAAASTRPHAAIPDAASIIRAPAPTTEAWITIRGGRFTVGLTPPEVDRLAFASANAARVRVERDPDPLHGLRELEELEERTGNVEYLRRVVRAAFPPREVEVPEFQIARAPVTNREWALFLAETKLPPPDDWKLPGGDAPERPVVEISWDEARRYAEWAGAALPSEVQWERAARGLEHRLFPWGDAWGDEGGWIDRQPHDEPWPSSAHAELASPDGVLDMVTRRWEWCADVFEPRGADVATLATLFPKLVADGRVRRGGKGPILVASTLARTGTDPSWRAWSTGFRLVRRT
jgi:formylglycine-generating enzyme required for sulfatase activity